MSGLDVLRGRAAILFDYGNTLVPFGPAELDALDDAFAAALRARFGDVDRAALRAIRARDRLAPYDGAWRENDLRTTTSNTVNALFGVTPTAADVEALIAARRAAFVDLVAVGEGAREALARLGATARLALVSNYPDGDAIRASVARLGLRFDAVVVSGDLGFVKPHPAPFLAALAAVGVPAAAAAHVGDHWLADVQGAKRLGMAAVWVRRWAPPEVFEPGPDDLPPDATITDLDAL